MRPGENSIRYSLIRINRLTVGIVLLISLLALTTYNFSSYKKTLERNLAVQARIISTNSSAAILFNNREDAEETLSSLGTVPDIVTAVLYTKNGNVFAAYQKEKTTEGIPSLFFQEQGYQFSRNYLSLIQPVVIDTETIGTIYIKSDLKDLYFYLLAHLILIVVVIVVSLLTAREFLSRLQKTITNPINDLVELMKTVSEGKNYSVNALLHGPSELQSLSHGFNEMLGQIQKRDMELNAHRQNLEEMVYRRTNELAQTNVLLKEELIERQKAESALISTKAQLQHLLVSSPAVIYSCNPDADFLFTFVSDNVKDQFGYEPDEFLEDPIFWRSNINTEDLDLILAGRNSLLNRGHHIHEYRFKHKDGTYLWVRDEMRLITNDKGNPFEIVGYWIDITEQKHAEEQITQRAFYDQLTGLPNRSLFIDRLRVSLEYRKRNQDYLFAVLFIDVDRFKIVNDSLGHSLGDQLLVMIAQRLKKCVRTFDTVARFGGDEFAVLLDNIRGVAEIIPIIERIQNEMKLPCNLTRQEVVTSFSIGVALSDMSPYIQPEEILRDADIAMYYAKANGKACYVLFDASMHAQAVKVLQMETDLRMAIERHEFVLHYQPVVSMEDDKIIGFEALLRWVSPNGIVYPDEFISVAEETGLIVPIGKWVLYEACRQMSEWQERFPQFQHLTVSVNLSTKEFSQPNFIQLIENILQRTGLEARNLKLELTEKMIIENFEHAATVFQQLRALNVQVLIDDFGTGYSALNYMLYLPIDSLKIDRFFVRKAGANENVKEIVKTIITLAHALKMDVIVEGIETEEEMSLFKKMKSEYAQGFLFSKPLDNTSVEKLLEHYIPSVPVHNISFDTQQPAPAIEMEDSSIKNLNL